MVGGGAGLRFHFLDDREEVEEVQCSVTRRGRIAHIALLWQGLYIRLTLWLPPQPRPGGLDSLAQQTTLGRVGPGAGFPHQTGGGRE